MHISANMRPKICIKGRLIISSKVVTIWVVKKGEGEGADGDKVSQGGGGKKLVVGR